ncbi:hypothetical protein M8310_15155 [Enterobacter hormaechei]|nr:hypothetical protein [Enterobacter hormaechei]
MPIQKTGRQEVSESGGSVPVHHIAKAFLPHQRVTTEGKGMGTRHLTCVVKDGDYKVAQYGQWDGYPSGQGVDILSFLREKLNREIFLVNLAQTFEPTDEQIKEWWLEVGHDIDKSDGWVGCDISRKYGEKHPSLHRDTGGDILDLIQDASSPVPISKNLDFAADSLFCEWAYVIDFDKNTFEVFQGFNQLPLEQCERFHFLSEKCSNNYQPVRHSKTYQLCELPDEEKFLTDLEPGEEEE